MMWRLFILLTLITSISAPIHADDTVKIGVLAKRGDVVAQNKWNNTANYLSQEIVGHQFEIIPLDFNELKNAVKQNKIDFVITNTLYYVQLEYDFGLSRIATLKNLGLHGEALTDFGGVIITCKDSKIKTLQDLRGKSFGAVNKDSFGGWVMAEKELLDNGVRPSDFSQLSFLNSHDAVVKAVQSGSIDAGTIRTDTLERMAAEGLIEMGKCKILDEKHPQGFPYKISTELYPEWPFAKLSATPEKLANQVLIALLNMPADSAAAKDARIAGWTTPLDYSKVNQLLKELNIGPFEVQIQKIELQKHQKSLTEIISIEEMVFVAIVFLFALFLLIKYYGKSKLLDIKLTTFNKGLILFELGVILFLSYELLVLDRLEHALAKSYEQRHQMVNAADELRQSSDDLSRFARSYAVTGNSEFKNRFFHILDIRNGTAPRPQNYNEIYWDLDKETRRQRHPDSENIALNSLFETLPLSPLEREKLQESEANSNTLTKLESSAFAAMEKGQQATAIKLLHSHEYYAAKQQIMLPIDEMLQMLRLRTEGEIAVLHSQVTNHFHFLIGAGILFFIGNIFVYLLLRRKINQPVAYLTNVIKDFQNGTRDCKFKQFYNDEIGYMIQQFFVMQAIINDANDEVAEQKAFLRTLLDSQEQIIITLHDKNLYQANASFHQFFGTASIEDFHAKYRVSCISDLFSEMVPEEYLTAEKDGQDWIDFMLDNPDISTHKAMILLGEEAYIFAATAARLPTKEKMTSVVFTNITEMETAKQEVDALNQRTQESINYASLIQKALLPSEDILQKHFTDYFAIWQPRDIVGGDIFFVEELDEEHLLLMVIDCTGHGVPGALVTMLVKAIERQLVSTIRRTNEKVSPANLLGIYNKSIKHLLQQNRHDSLSNAGFDGAILYYDKVQNILRFAGANIPLFLHSESELTEIRGDRHSIGYRSSKSDFNFTDHEITINAPLSVYLTTDGYLDQNGGTKGFPFGKRRFKQMINELSDLEMAQQKNEFLQHLHDYQGNEQTNDDLTIVALKIEPNTK